MIIERVYHYHRLYLTIVRDDLKLQRGNSVMENFHVFDRLSDWIDLGRNRSLKFVE